MPSLAVIGAQWGDEGKGKLVDYLTRQADYVVRFQGGNNAGHTLVVEGVTTKLNLVPSGILHPNTRCLLGAGVVIDPAVLITELDGLERSGVQIGADRILIDRDAHLILDYHRAIDLAREKQKGDKKIGTTGRGIGPAYEDRAERSGVRMAELLSLAQLKPRLQEVVLQKNKYLKHILEDDTVVDFPTLWGAIEGYAKRLAPLIGNVSLEPYGAIKSDSKIVFEGAQGTLLDQAYGSVPYVTSSNTIAGAVTTGCGIGPKSIEYVLGVAKAYTTRVGSGPFPTELKNELGKFMLDKGVEYGTVTRRPRRCGWFDAVAMQRANRLNGFDSLAITKLDVLSGLDELKICIKYKLDGQELDDVPALPHDFERVEPQYITLPGWKEEIGEARKWHHLPVNARLYLSTIAELVGVPVSLISVGAERMSTIFLSSADFLKNFVD